MKKSIFTMLMGLFLFAFVAFSSTPDSYADSEQNTELVQSFTHQNSYVSDFSKQEVGLTYLYTSPSEVGYNDVVEIVEPNSNSPPTVRYL